MSSSRWKIFAVSVAAVVVIIGLFLILEQPQEAAEPQIDLILKEGMQSFSELSVVGRMRVTIYRYGKPVLREEIPTPVEHLLIAKALEPIDERTRFKLGIYKRLMEISSGFKFDKDFLNHHQAVVTGAKKVAGRWCWEMEIRPNSVEGGYLTVSFDKETSYPLKRVKYDREGMKENAIEFVKVETFKEKMGRFRPPRFRQEPMGLPPREGPFGRRPPQGRPEPPKPQAFIPPDVFLRDYISQGRVLYPTNLPDGYHFRGGVKLPLMPGGKMGRIHMVFSDGVNNLSIFQIHLPTDDIRGGDVKEFLRKKAGQFLNSFPEGMAMRRVKEGLIVGLGDIAPEMIQKVIDSMVPFKGDKPALLDEDLPINPEGLY